MDLRAGLHDLEKRKILTLPKLELRPLRRPAFNQSLYRLPIFCCSACKCFSMTDQASEHTHGNISVNPLKMWCSHVSFLISLNGVRLSPLGTSATNWSIAPAPDDRWWVWSSRWNENWQRKPKYSEETYRTWFTTNPTWPDLGSNPGRRCGRPATNRLV
jgi:hypothetical protein